MNCFNHSETPAVAYCRTCGKALCTECKRTAQGTIFCDEHAPAAAIEGAIRQAVVDRMAQETAAAMAPPRPAASTATGDVSPGLACLLGFIPGVGAIYNGQYAKGLVHAIVFGLLVSITGSGTAGDLIFESLLQSGGFEFVLAEKVELATVFKAEEIGQAIFAYAFGAGCAQQYAVDVGKAGRIIPEHGTRQDVPLAAM